MTPIWSFDGRRAPRRRRPWSNASTSLCSGRRRGDRGRVRQADPSSRDDDGVQLDVAGTGAPRPIPPGHDEQVAWVWTSRRSWGGGCGRPGSRPATFPGRRRVLVLVWELSEVGSVPDDQCIREISTRRWRVAILDSQGFDGASGQLRAQLRIQKGELLVGCFRRRPGRSHWR